MEFTYKKSSEYMQHIYDEMVNGEPDIFMRPERDTAEYVLLRIIVSLIDQSSMHSSEKKDAFGIISKYITGVNHASFGFFADTDGTEDPYHRDQYYRELDEKYRFSDKLSDMGSEWRKLLAHGHVRRRRLLALEDWLGQLQRDPALCGFSTFRSGDGVAASY